MTSEFIFSSELTIQTPIEDLWDYTTTPKNWEGTHPQTVRVYNKTGAEIDLTQPLRLGAIFREVTRAKLFGIPLTQDWEWVCSGRDKHESFHFHGWADNLYGSIHYEFEEKEGRVHFTRSFLLIPSTRFQKIGLKLLSPEMNRAGNEYLQNIKSKLEKS